MALGAVCTALVVGPAPAAPQQNAANPGNAGGGGNGRSACSCIDPSTLNQIYATELGMRPTQPASKHCAVAPTFLDIEQSVVSVREAPVAVDQKFARGVVNTAPEVTIKSQFLVYIDSNPLKPMGSCEVKTVRGAATTRDVNVAITHQEAWACMQEIQASRAWEELCVGEVLKSQ